MPDNDGRTTQTRTVMDTRCTHNEEGGAVLSNTSVAMGFLGVFFFQQTLTRLGRIVSGVGESTRSRNFAPPYM